MAVAPKFIASWRSLCCEYYRQLFKSRVRFDTSQQAITIKTRHVNVKMIALIFNPLRSFRGHLDHRGQVQLDIRLFWSGKQRTLMESSTTKMVSFWLLFRAVVGGLYSSSKLCDLTQQSSAAILGHLLGTTPSPKIVATIKAREAWRALPVCCYQGSLLNPVSNFCSSDLLVSLFAHCQELTSTQLEHS